MANEKVTSNDVARLAGVSQSAVSRFFTPGTSVSKRTAEKIKAAADQLGYRPNVLARSLITGKSHIIGLVVAYLENYFYPDVVERLSRSLQDQGYHVLVFISSLDADKVEETTQEILDYQVDGIVLASANMSSELAARCHASGIPIVLFNRLQDDERLSAVASNNVGGGRLLARHLIETGRRKLAYIAGFEGASTQRDRERGFLEGLAEGGLQLFARDVGNFRYEEAQAAARRLFSGEQRPDAVFVCNDHMAFAVMDVLRFELGLNIPGDVSVVGFDDVPLARWPAYNLTTIRQNVDHMVAETVNILLTAIEERDTPARRVSLDGELIVRGSTVMADPKS